MGCDMWTMTQSREPNIFQSTHPYGVRLNSVFLASADARFQSTHPYGVRLIGCELKRAGSGFQSTHPYGVRRDCAAPSLAAPPISIHAPVWGATVRRACEARKIKISIHAPVWGATCTGLGWDPWGVNFNPRTRMGCDASEAIAASLDLDFNPRTRMGCDHIRGGELAFQPFISIHAPVWGATICTRVSSKSSR